MHFVGIIADWKDYEFIKKELTRNKKYSQLELINITEKNIENIKNIKFRIIVICNDIDKMSDKKEYINAIIKDVKYLIINSDIDINLELIKKNEIQVITYGLNQKATVTTSSVEEDSTLICLQRNIKNLSNRLIEVQDYKIKSENITNKKLYNLMVAFIVKVLCD